MKCKAIEASQLLNDFVLDLVVGTRSIELFESQGIKARLSESISLGLFRMALFHILLTLFKWAEFYDRYNLIIPVELHDVCRDLRKQIGKGSIREFRNKYVGHIWDNDKKRPLLKEEVDIYFNQKFGDTVSFLQWVNRSNAVYPQTVVSICEKVRDSLKVAHGITEKEMFPWADNPSDVGV